MRTQNRKVSARATALTLVLGVVGVLVTALPAWAAAPVTGTFSPLTGPPGTAVTVAGTGFLNFGTPVVRFNGNGGALASNVTVASDISLTAVVPCAAVDGPINVQNNDGNDDSTANFDVTAATAPTISSFLPTSGPVGTSVVITGTNFCQTSQVLFNATPAVNVTINSPTSITAVVPVGATTGLIRVTTPVLPAANSATNFTVAAAPTITSFSPTSGNVGTSVVITGTNLSGVTAVRFNGVTATFSANTATSVTAVVPSGATTGRIVVVTPGGTATSATDFTVTTAPVARSVTFGFQPNSRVSGSVNVTSGLAACRSLLPVVIQKLKNNDWKWVDTTATTKSGTYKTYIPPSNGRFRAKVNQITLVNGVVCGGSTSNVVHS
jgi:ethanolamine utilization microcompartment shell protein EutS